MPDLTCIYCLRDVPAEGFNTEHVISQAFGTFESNLTLTDMVCRSCNQYFGDNLERVFARDSFEAYYRITTNLRPAEHIRAMPQRRLTLTAAPGAEWEGLRLALIAAGGDAAVTLEPQVGLPKTASRGWTYLTGPELADRARPLPADFDRQGHIHVIGPTGEVR
ncbi:MAG: HNH endonuclease [Alphaproteobacteria bacterium]|nr:HNH endonuclease [Alphaproteobacteria bacterium]